MLFVKYFFLCYMSLFDTPKLYFIPYRKFFLDNRYVIKTMLDDDNVPIPGWQNNKRYKLTTKGRNYLHELNLHKGTAIRSWLAIIISCLALYVSLFK